MLCTLHCTYNHTIPHSTLHIYHANLNAHSKLRNFIYSFATTRGKTPGISSRIYDLAAVISYTSTSSLSDERFILLSNTLRYSYESWISQTTACARMIPQLVHHGVSYPETVVRHSGRQRYAYIQRCELVTGYRLVVVESIDEQGESRFFRSPLMLNPAMCHRYRH